MIPTILVAGLGETGFELTKRLAHNWNVVAIDTNRSALDKIGKLSHNTYEIRIHHGDATSALVLKKAQIENVHAVVVCAGSDEVNLEILRLVKEHWSITNRVALMYSFDFEADYNDIGCQIVSQDHACSMIMESMIQRGRRVAQEVGLGHGEILEVEVLPNSIVVGRALKNLGPRKWIVGAIYRNNELIVPHGNTIIESGDRVLLIGKPEILPSIATMMQSGESKFPLQYGTHIVSLFQLDSKKVIDEVAYLIKNTKADLLETIYCNADEDATNRLMDHCKAAGITYKNIACFHHTDEEVILESRNHDMGVLIMPPEEIGFLAKVGLGKTRVSRVAEKVNSPILMARGSYPYKKVLLPIVELPFDNAAAGLAIDLVRKLDAELYLAAVHQPDIVEGSHQREDFNAKLQQVENLATMYHVQAKLLVLEGNPIYAVLNASSDYDLIVLPYQKGKKGSITRPHVGLNIIHRSKCSVMFSPY